MAVRDVEALILVDTVSGSTCSCADTLGKVELTETFKSSLRSSISMSSESLSSHHRRSQMTKDSQFRIANFASALATKNKKNGK